jgi:hypothetical protein
VRNIRFRLSTDGRNPFRETGNSHSTWPVHSGREGGKKKCKQRPQGVMTTTDHDDDNDGEAGGSSVRRISTTTRSDKH